jgi:hypothetical protein
MTVNLNIICRCGHARRFHRSGSLMAGGDNGCYYNAHPAAPDYPEYCYYFEAADGWQDSFADALREKGWLVQRPVRNESGRFVSARADS